MGSVVPLLDDQVKGFVIAVPYILIAQFVDGSPFSGVHARGIFACGSAGPVPSCCPASCSGKGAVESL